MGKRASENRHITEEWRVQWEVYTLYGEGREGGRGGNAWKEWDAREGVSDAGSEPVRSHSLSIRLLQ